MSTPIDPEAPHFIESRSAAGDMSADRYMLVEVLDRLSIGASMLRKADEIPTTDDEPQRRERVARIDEARACMAALAFGVCGAVQDHLGDRGSSPPSPRRETWPPVPALIPFLCRWPNGNASVVFAPSLDAVHKHFENDALRLGLHVGAWPDGSVFAVTFEPNGVEWTLVEWTLVSPNTIGVLGDTKPALDARKRFEEGVFTIGGVRSAR